MCDMTTLSFALGSGDVLQQRDELLDGGLDGVVVRAEAAVGGGLCGLCDVRGDVGALDDLGLGVELSLADDLGVEGAAVQLGLRVDGERQPDHVEEIPGVAEEGRVQRLLLLLGGHGEVAADQLRQLLRGLRQVLRVGQGLPLHLVARQEPLCGVQLAHVLQRLGFRDERTAQIEHRRQEITRHCDGIVRR